MEAGHLTNRVQIQKPGSEENSWGQPVPDSWVDHAQVWASIRYLSGSESIRAGAETSVARVSIRIRYREDLDNGMRVLYRGKKFLVKAVLPDEIERDHLDLVCEVVT